MGFHGVRLYNESASPISFLFRCTYSNVPVHLSSPDSIEETKREGRITVTYAFIIRLCNDVHSLSGFLWVYALESREGLRVNDRNAEGIHEGRSSSKKFLDFRFGPFLLYTLLLSTVFQNATCERYEYSPGRIPIFLRI